MRKSFFLPGCHLLDFSFSKLSVSHKKHSIGCQKKHWFLSAKALSNLLFICTGPCICKGPLKSAKCAFISIRLITGEWKATDNPIHDCLKFAPAKSNDSHQILDRHWHKLLKPYLVSPGKEIIIPNEKFNSIIISYRRKLWHKSYKDNNQQSTDR